ncbi:MAG: radical SAM protein, partial [Muribaculaceae bacterium]|nr:radical SAM protein [Muribaculaceae bacterium]
SADELLEMYTKASESEDVVGVIIGTRPDCLAEDLLDGLAKLNRRRPVIVEIGAETSFDDTLRLINRNHTWRQVEEAAMGLHSRGVRVGLHLIAGLPGENDDDVIETIKKACELPIESIKMHQLQIVKGTLLLEKWQKGEINVKPFMLEDYLKLCVRIVKSVPRHICIERFLASSPPEMVVAPKWGLKNYQFTNLLMNKLKQN